MLRILAIISCLLVANAYAQITCSSATQKFTHATAQSYITTYGIGRSSSGSCSDRTVSTCTSLEQVNCVSIKSLITLKQASGCAITVTGGTEIGHAGGTTAGTYSHWNGYKIDISVNTCIDNYIQNSFAYIGLRSDGYHQWKAGSGNVYCREGNHWDITFYA